MERVLTGSEHKRSVRFSLTGVIFSGLIVLALFKLFGGTFGVKPTDAEEVRIAAERKARQVATLERLKTVELPATGITDYNDLFWIVDRYEQSPSFTEVLIEWSDNAHREHRDIEGFSHVVRMVAGKEDRSGVQIILDEWWMLRTLQRTNADKPISLPPPK